VGWRCVFIRALSGTSWRCSSSVVVIGFGAKIATAVESFADDSTAFASVVAECIATAAEAEVAVGFW
jgi:hypothetical protein